MRGGPEPPSRRAPFLPRLEPAARRVPDDSSTRRGCPPSLQNATGDPPGRQWLPAATRAQAEEAALVRDEAPSHAATGDVGLRTRSCSEGSSPEKHAASANGEASRLLADGEDALSLRPAEDAHSLRPAEDAHSLRPPEDAHSLRPPEDAHSLRPAEDAHSLRPSEDAHSPRPAEDALSFRPAEDAHSLHPPEDADPLGAHREALEPHLRDHRDGSSFAALQSAARHQLAIWERRRHVRRGGRSVPDVRRPPKGQLERTRKALQHSRSSPVGMPARPPPPPPLAAAADPTAVDVRYVASFSPGGKIKQGVDELRRQVEVAAAATRSESNQLLMRRLQILDGNWARQRCDVALAASRRLDAAAAGRAAARRDRCDYSSGAAEEGRLLPRAAPPHHSADGADPVKAEVRLQRSAAVPLCEPAQPADLVGSSSPDASGGQSQPYGAGTKIHQSDVHLRSASSSGPLVPEADRSNLKPPTAFRTSCLNVPDHRASPSTHNTSAATPCHATKLRKHNYATRDAQRHCDCSSAEVGVTLRSQADLGKCRVPFLYRPPCA